MILDTFLNASKLTLIHVILIFGLTGLITAALFLLQRMICISFSKTTGWKGVYLTAWIGTPVHELGHAIFCLIFRHKINEVALFKPDKASGVLGYVSHNYNPKSFYQSIGNFFIGIAPLLVGSLILYLLFDTFFPDLAAEPVKSKFELDNFNNSTVSVLKEVYSKISGNISIVSGTLIKPTILSVIILYIMTSISAHIAPSHTDLKNALPGFGLLVALIFIINLVLSFLKINSASYVDWFTTFLGRMHGILIFGLALTILTFILIYIPLFIFYLIKRKKLLNPFY